MVKKSKNIKKDKSNKKKVNLKINISSKSQRNSFKIENLQISDIEFQIINHVRKNKSSLNYYLCDEKKFKINKEVIEKVKNSCLCRISDEFGSAVCIHENGYILTCAHAAPPFEDELNRESLYIFPNGEIVKTLTLEKDEQLDLALLKIIEIYENYKFVKVKKHLHKKFSFSKIIYDSKKNEKIGENIFCIGNPCFTMYDDEGKLEKNKYKPFWISFGKIKGYIKDGIYCKNDLGPLIHNCWTYWGHSGAPIFNENGELVGMHNSWNERNANRHGNSLLGIIQFLSKFDFLIK